MEGKHQYHSPIDGGKKGVKAERERERRVRIPFKKDNYCDESNAIGMAGTTVFNSRKKITLNLKEGMWPPLKASKATRRKSPPKRDVS